MAIAIEDIARELNVAPDRLLHESVRAYIAQQERLVRADMADLADRYGVPSAEALRAAVSTKEVHSHPAWEDAIEWEHLEAYLAQLQELQSRLASDV